MKFIHTSDWHLGKSIDGKSRLGEQEKFCNDFINIVEENNIDMVIIAGDIYDTYSPLAQAEKLFYRTVSLLANNGQRCVFIIAGEHDNPERLASFMPLAHEQGIIVLENPLSRTNKSKYNGFEILEAKNGCTKIKIRDEEIVIITIPYPSEKRLNEAIKCVGIHEETQKTYSEKIGEIFRSLEKNFEENTINIVVSHISVEGGESTNSERPIDLNGNSLVKKKDLPSNAQYIALGHLHKQQKVPTRLNAYYSGSPISYSKDERCDKKGAYIVDIKPRKTPNIQNIYFDNYKPIEVFKCNGIEEAIKICEENKNRDIWSYFEIKTKEVISKSDMKKMKETLKDIIEIRSIIESDYVQKDIDIKEKSMAELFNKFYTFSNGLEPKGELMDLFLDIISEEGDM